MDKLTIYHHLPNLLKTIAASFKGYQLQRIRYSDYTDTLVEEAIEREKWDSNRWQTYQQVSIDRILEYAAKEVPFYRSLWDKRKQNGDKASIHYLENWPILHKEELRSSPEAFIAENVNRNKLILDHTSGTSGVPLRLWFDQSAIRQWFALFEARWRGWYSLTRKDRWALFGGQLIIPFERKKPPFWVWNYGMNQLYMSTYHISPAFAYNYLDAIKRYEIKYIYGYASSLYRLAKISNEQGFQSLSNIRAVISNAEPLYSYQRKMISQIFGCPVYNTYGQSENVFGGSECLSGNLHFWPEIGYPEIMDISHDSPKLENDMGRLICTGLINFAMPLIRYDVGDLLRLNSKNPQCNCGRKMPIIKEIQGRMEDMIVTRDGRWIEGPDTVFQDDWPIREVQIIQESYELIKVLVVPSTGYNQKTTKNIEDGLKKRVGDIEIKVEKVNQIPSGRNGKRKLIVSHLGQPK